MPNEKTADEIIAEQLKKIPPEVKEVFLSVDYTKKLEEVNNKQGLLTDQANKLETETSLVMLGLEPITDYTANLVKNLGITKEKAGAIMIDVYNSIFENIVEKLKKMDAEMLEGDETVVEEEILPNNSKLNPEFAKEVARRIRESSKGGTENLFDETFNKSIE